MVGRALKKALFYNRFLNTAGGGERLTLEWCLALSQIGYDITIATAASFNRTIQSLCDIFAIPGSERWSLKIVDTEDEVAEFCKSEGFDLFVNGSFCSSMENPAPLGIYSLMFPQAIDATARRHLLSYQHVLVISEFSEIYTKHWWGSDFPVQVLTPPISNSHMDISEVSFAGKEKVILNIGRFNVVGHCKRQLDAIQTFQTFLAEKIIGDDWHFYAVGNLNEGEENLRYLNACRQSAGPNVHIETDVSFERLQQLYVRASVLWQFTGSHLPSGRGPQYCEHLGLVAMDGLCYGVVPMVYQRSGVGYMIDHGRTGFTFSCADELKDIMAIFDRAFGTNTHHSMFRLTREYSTELGFPSFKRKLATYVSEALE